MMAFNINQRLNGIHSPLSYIGANALQPTDFVTKPRDPVSSDSKNFQLGTWWLNTTPYNASLLNYKLWYLASLSGNVAVWILVGGGSGTVLGLTGNSGGFVMPTLGNINVVGDGTTINVVGTPGTSTLTISTIGSDADTFPTDFTGPALPTAGVLNIYGGVSTDPEQVALVYRQNIHTAAATNTVFIKLNDSMSFPATNTAGTAGVIYSGGVATGNRFIHNYGTNNAFVGLGAGNFNLTVGSAVQNVGIGSGTLASITTGASNVAVGFNALNAITSGNINCALGVSAGSGLTVANSNNIMIVNNGTAGDSGRIRIGTNAIHTTAFVAGIDGVNVGSVAKVVTMASDQLGTATITAGTSITVTPTANVITITNSAPAVGSTSVAFAAYLTADVLNQTGAGTAVTVVFNATTINTGTAYATGTGIFTAPSTGFYQFNTSVSVGGIAAGMDTGLVQFKVAGTSTSVGDWSVTKLNPLATLSVGAAEWDNSGSVAFNLDAGDTVRVSVRIAGGGGDTADIIAGVVLGATHFSGFKVA